MDGTNDAIGKHLGNGVSCLESLTARYEQMLERIAALICDVRSLIDLLEANIEVEEGSTGEFDPASSNYSVWARRLRARRDNLVSTLSELDDEPLIFTKAR